MEQAIVAFWVVLVISLDPKELNTTELDPCIHVISIVRCVVKDRPAPMGPV